MPWKKWSCLKPVSCVKIVTCNNISDESDHWPLIGQERSRDLDTGLWLADRVITYRMRSGVGRGISEACCVSGAVYGQSHSIPPPAPALLTLPGVSCHAPGSHHSHMDTSREWDGWYWISMDQCWLLSHRWCMVTWYSVSLCHVPHVPPTCPTDW